MRSVVRLTRAQHAETYLHMVSECFEHRVHDVTQVETRVEDPTDIEQQRKLVDLASNPGGGHSRHERYRNVA